jgi:hypothetical protein
LARQLVTLQGTLVREHTQAPGLFGEIARMEELLADTYRNRVAYELLQNSDDAGARTVVVEALDSNGFRWSNDGRPLDLSDIEALCRSASSTKQRGDSIGYRGIGFKSLAAITSHVEVHSANVVFAFDRSASAALLGGVGATSVPLIRIPTEIGHGLRTEGAAFTVTYRPGISGGLDTFDPISAVFLRNVEHIRFGLDDGTRQVRVTRGSDNVVLRLDEGEARFGLLHHGSAAVAVPLNSRASALTGVRGRLACFLPLDDEVGLPVIISGDLLTDPSRTHAVVTDNSTVQVLTDAARAIADCLRSPGDPVSEQLWELILTGEDLRSLLVTTSPSASKTLLSSLREDMTTRRPPFAYSSIPLEPEDISALFPDGAPMALYAHVNQAAARAVRTVLGLRDLDFSAVLATPSVPALSRPLRTRLGHHFQDLARTHGRKLTDVERELVQAEPPQAPMPASSPAPPVVQISKSKVVQADSLPAVLARWRTAELATMEFLNGHGWDLRDVSTQNTGYDLEGSNPEGQPVRLEVKKVDRPNARFALTNNEMALMLAAGASYLIAVLIGDGQHAKLMLLDPSAQDLPRERVCRRWDWEFTDWQRYAIAIE